MTFYECTLIQTSNCCHFSALPPPTLDRLDRIHLHHHLHTYTHTHRSTIGQVDSLWLVWRLQSETSITHLPTLPPPPPGVDPCQCHGSSTQGCNPKHMDVWVQELTTHTSAIQVRGGEGRMFLCITSLIPRSFINYCIMSLFTVSNRTKLAY